MLGKRKKFLNDLFLSDVERSSFSFIVGSDLFACVPSELLSSSFDIRRCFSICRTCPSGVRVGNFHCRTNFESERVLVSQQTCKQVNGLCCYGEQGECAYFLAMKQNVIAWRDFRVDAVLAVDGPRYEIEIVLAVVAFARREERAVEVVAVVENRPAAAVPPRQLNARRLQLTHVGLAERILVAPDDHARIVQPQHENVMVAKVVVLVNPIF